MGPAPRSKYKFTCCVQLVPRKLEIQKGRLHPDRRLEGLLGMAVSEDFKVGIKQVEMLEGPRRLEESN